MTASVGTRPAYVPIDGKRGYNTTVPFTILDGEGLPYGDFEDWVFNVRFAPGPGTEAFFTLTSPAFTPGGSYINQSSGSDREFEMTLSALDQSFFAMSSGPMPDRYYYEMDATGPAFGRWPIVSGEYTVAK